MQSRLTAALSSHFFLVPLQVHNDAQRHIRREEGRRMPRKKHADRARKQNKSTARLTAPAKRVQGNADLLHPARISQAEAGASRKRRQ